MTTEGNGFSRLERALAAIAALLGLAWALGSAGHLAEIWPILAWPVGWLPISLTGLSVAIGLVAAVTPAHSRRTFLVAAIVAAVAVPCWIPAIHGTLPAGEVPWFVAMATQMLVCAMMAIRRAVPVAIWAACAWTAYAIVESWAGHTGLLAAVLLSGIFVPLSFLLSMLILVVDRVADDAQTAQQLALLRLRRARFDDATETERVRTDALVHDTVLTTLLQAASAGDPAGVQLAHRMAGNAIRVLAHVTQNSDRGFAVPLRLAIGERSHVLSPYLPYFDIAAGGMEDLTLPVDAADALILAMSAAMKNSVQHARADSRHIRLAPLGADGVRIIIDDDGVGFDPSEVMGNGILQDIVERMRAVDGRADVESMPGHGATVQLSWGSVVIPGVAPLGRDTRADAR